MSQCPSCGRYVGPYEACPYCGACLTGRTPIRMLKVAAIILATVGLATLWFAAIHAEVPTLQIGQAGATMNMAYVRIEGRCTRSPSYDAESDYLSFWIDDDTGEIRIGAYRAETRAIIEQDRVPALGDRVEVAGTMRVRDDFLSLTINVPEQLEITRAQAVERGIGTISPRDEYARVRVRGQVRGIREPYEGLTLITVRDRTGSIPVAVSKDLIAFSGVTPTLTTGQSVEVVAAVSVYGDTPQLVPASAADIVPLSEPVAIATEKQIGELTTADVGQLTILRGALTDVELFSHGLKSTLDDGTGTIILLLWQSVYGALPNPAALNIGAEVRVQGELSQYRGELELIPQLTEEVELLTAAALSEDAAADTLTDAAPTSQPTPTPTDQPARTPIAPPQETPTPALEQTPIEAVTADRVGDTVTVEGTVVGTASFSAGFKFTLDDGRGQVVLLMWHDVYDDCRQAPDINLGAKVRATGEIAEYEGTLQVQPAKGGHVKVIEGTTAWAAPREIGGFTGDDEGKRAMIEGQVVRLEGSPSAVKVFVSDATGEIVVFIWRTVLDRIADNRGLGTPGRRVRVVGTVEIYRSNLEMIPTLPSDVTVLP